jgi:hypothetical protein
MQKRLIGLVIIMLVGAASAAAAVTLPRSTVRPTISGTARQGELLTADPGTWSGTQPMTFAYQWRRCDTDGANCSSIVGATGKTYTLTSADVGNRLRVRVRASNDAGARTATSAATAVVVALQKTVSLNVSESPVLYGRAVTLFGSVANGQLGEPVTVVAHQLPSFSGAEVRAVATVQTNAEGSFNLLVRPASHTLYTASNGQTTSNAVSVSVRPRVSLTRSSGHRFVLRAVAARSFVGRYGVIQRWSLRRHHWLSLRRVFFTRAFPGVSPTITSRAVFRARFGGARIRVLIPRSPGYLSGVSNVLSA